MPDEEEVVVDPAKIAGTPENIAAIEAAETPAPETPSPWASALVVAGGLIPTNETRKVVVVEYRGDDGALSKTSSYPQKGDLYFRTDPDVDFGGQAAGALTLGVDVQQGIFGGFSILPGVLNVGPAHPAFAGANLAAQQGATEIEIVGLSAMWKERLQPWFDGLATDPQCPSDVKVTLT